MDSKIEDENSLEWAESRMRAWDTNSDYSSHSPSHGFIYMVLDRIFKKKVEQIVGDKWNVTCGYGQDALYVAQIGVYGSEKSTSQNQLLVPIANPAPLFTMVTKNSFPTDAFDEIRDLFIKFDLDYIPIELARKPYDGKIAWLSEKYTWWDRYFGY